MSDEATAALAKVIPPRSERESAAYIAGYAQALSDARMYGIERVAYHLDVMAGPLDEPLRPPPSRSG